MRGEEKIEHFRPSYPGRILMCVCDRAVCAYGLPVVVRHRSLYIYALYPVRTHLGIGLRYIHLCPLT